MKAMNYSVGELKELGDALRTLGASGNGVKIYTASFRGGRMTVGKLATVCGMDRSSAYLACDQLVALGVMDSDESEAKRMVLAKEPKAVLARLRTEMRKFRRHHDAIEEGMTSLLASYVDHSSKPVLQFFSGADGLRQITDDVLEHAEGEILLLTNQASEKNVFSAADHAAFVAGRLSRGIAIRVLATDVPESRELRRLDKGAKRETRIVSGVPFTSETYIYGNTVAMLSFDKEILGFTVRSVEFAQSQKWMFEQLWSQHE